MYKASASCCLSKGRTQTAVHMRFERDVILFKLGMEVKLLVAVRSSVVVTGRRVERLPQKLDDLVIQEDNYRK